MRRSSRASVSRETRQLLVVLLVATSALWVLARLRFPDRVPNPNPVGPVLAQLSPPSAFDDVTDTVVRVQDQLAGAFVTVGAVPGAAEAPRSTRALRLDSRVAVTRLSSVESAFDTAEWAELFHDRATRLAVLRTNEGSSAGVPTSMVRRLDRPRFFLACPIESGGTLELRPVFVSGLSPASDPAWGDVWLVPDGGPLMPDSFVFAVDGSFVGLAIKLQDRLAIAPAAVVRSLAERIVAAPRGRPGWLGIDAEPLTPALARATGSTQGVIVRSVHRSSPAATQLRPGDVVERFDLQEVPTLTHWRSHVDRLAEGDEVVLSIRRDSESIDVPVSAIAPPPRVVPRDRPLGLTMRAFPAGGVEVVRVAPESVAAHADIQVGDVITTFGSLDRPTGAQITRHFHDAQEPIAATVARADRRLLVVFEKK
jgi:hypothetical protein